MRGIERALELRRTSALVLLALGVVAYPVAWNVDPYVFAFAVLGLGSLQLAIGVIGMMIARVAP